MSTKTEILRLRERLGWTQEQMAEYLGLDRSSVSRMENGQPLKGPALKMIEALRKRGTTSKGAAA